MSQNIDWGAQQAAGLQNSIREPATAEGLLRMRLEVLQGHITNMNKYEAEANRIRRALAVLKGE